MSITLYGIPFSCTLATRLALREAQLPHQMRWVSRGALLIEGGDGDLRRINPKAKVPTLVLEDGTALTENIAVLSWIAERATGQRVDQPTLTWLSFIATELHKAVMSPVFDPLSPDATKEDVMQRLLPEALKVPEAALERSDFLSGGEKPSVADFYLLWTLFLAQYAGAELPPALKRFRDRMLQREAVAEVVAHERKKLKGVTT
jgi:glutathione S-transferase